MKKIIHLEDNLQYRTRVREIIFKIMVGKNVRLYPSINLEGAIALFEGIEGVLDLAITDYCLVSGTGDQGGVEFMKYIQGKSNSTPVVMFSSGDERVEKRMLRLGADYFVSKDHPEKLSRILEMVLVGVNNGTCN